MDQAELLNWICENYNTSPAFIPTTQIIHKMITKAALIKSEEHILTTINPKERKRRHDDNDQSEAIDKNLNELRVVGG